MSNFPNTTNLNIRVDSTLKQESDMLFKDLGLNMSTAINMFLTKCVKTSSIPFKIEEPKPSKELKKVLKELDYMMKHPEKYKSYNSVEELFEELDNDWALKIVVNVILEPDWLLVYQYINNELGLVLIVTGIHSKLF